MNRPRRIELAALQSLRNVGEHLMPEDLLATEVVNVLAPYRVTYAEVKATAATLERDGRIVGVNDHGDVKFKLTPKGEADLLAATA